MKLIKILVVIVIFIIAVPFNCLASENEVDSIIDNYSQELISSLDNETNQILSEFGFDTIKTESILNLDFSDILNCFKKAFTTHFRDTINQTGKIIVMLIALIILNSIRDKNKNILIDDVFLALIIIIVSYTISNTLTLFISVLKITVNYLASLIPVMTVMLSISGNITFSAIYSSMMIGFSQLLSFLSEKIFIPFTGIYFGIIISMNFNDITDSERISSLINNIATTLLSIVSTAYMLLMAAKNFISKDIDSLLLKSGKYLISSLIPVVGGAVSGVMDSVIASLNLVKSTIGIFAVLIELIINLPFFLNILNCRLSLFLMSSLCDSFGERKAASFIKSISKTIKLFSLLSFFEMITVIISTGLVVSVRSGI